MKYIYVDLNTAKSNPPKGEVLTSDTRTEQSGYVDPKRQIEDMILAGRRLDEARKNQYDFPSGKILTRIFMTLPGRVISTFRMRLKCNLRPLKE